MLTTTMTLRLDDEINSRLSNLAGAMDRSKAYLAKQALQLFLDNNEWQVQEINQTVAEADRASSNEFVDNDTVMDWMQSWGADHEGKPPL